jgi:protein-arginine kinase activator protein McsA
MSQIIPFIDEKKGLELKLALEKDANFLPNKIKQMTEQNPRIIEFLEDFRHNTEDPENVLKAGILIYSLLEKAVSIPKIEDETIEMIQCEEEESDDDDLERAKNLTYRLNEENPYITKYIGQLAKASKHKLAVLYASLIVYRLVEEQIGNKVTNLRKELEKLVKFEDYETAAFVRDELKGLGQD